MLTNLDDMLAIHDDKREALTRFGRRAPSLHLIGFSRRSHGITFSPVLGLACRGGRAAVAEAHLRELDGLADLMMQATLMAAGYHRHDRAHGGGDG